MNAIRLGDGTYESYRTYGSYLGLRGFVCESITFIP